MPRQQTIISGPVPVKADITVRRGETMRVTVTQAGENLVMTISETEGGLPTLPAIAAVAGVFTLSPATLFALVEGRKYVHNIWDVSDLTDIFQICVGSFTTSNTIEPDLSSLPSFGPLAAPTTDGTTPNVSYAQGSDPQTISTAQFFNGGNLSFSTNIGSINPATGVLTYTPLQPGVNTITITATNAAGSASQTFTLTVVSSVATLTISGVPSSSATVGQPYTYTPTVSGGTAPYTFTLTAGTLPAGLSLNNGTGAITGTPTTSQTQAGIALRVADNAGQVADLASFSIAVASEPATMPVNTVAPSISGSTTTGSTLTVTNGTWTGNPTPTYARQWRRDGTAIAGATGTTYVTQAADAGTTITCAVTATNTAGSATAISNSLAIPVAAPSASGSLADLSLTQNVTMTPVSVASAFTGTGISYGLAPSSAALPAGLGLSAAGILSGTPTAPVTARTIVVRGTNASGFADAAFSLTVAADYPALQTNMVRPGDIPVAYSGSAPILQILPNWFNGVLTTGNPSMVAFNTDRSITLNAEFVGANWNSGKTQIIKPQRGQGRWQWVASSTKPEAVLAMFLYDSTSMTTSPTAQSEIDFEYGVISNNGPTYGLPLGTQGFFLTVHMPRTTVGAGKRQLQAGFVPYTPEEWLTPTLFEIDHNETRTQWFIGGQMVGELTAAAMVAAFPDTFWTVDARMDAFSSCERHGSWAGWTTYTTANMTSWGVGLPDLVATLPVNRIAPTISGAPQVGSTLTTTNGTWTATPTATFTRQWRRNGTVIAGATASTYIAQSADVGTSITCAITGTNTAGNATAVSAGVTIAAEPVPAPTASGSLADLTLTQNVAMSDVVVSVAFTGSGITYALAPSSAALPVGLTLSTAGILSGTPTETVTARTIVVRGTNASGFADSAFSLTVAAPAQVAATTGYVLDGDSLTQGFGESPTYPAQLNGLTGLTSTNLGVSGRLLQEMDTTFASRNVAGLYDAAAANTLVISGGINDIMNGVGTTLTDLQNRMTSYCGKAKAAGFKVMIGTLTPVNGLATDRESLRTGFNTWIRSNAGTVGDGLVDFAAIAQLADPTDVIYYVDGLHLKPAGYALFAEAVRIASGVALFNGTPMFADTFDTALTGYTIYGFSSSFVRSVQAARGSVVSGRMRLTSSSQGLYPHAVKTLSDLEVGKTYRVDVDFTTTNRYFAGVEVMTTTNLDGATRLNVSDQPIGTIRMPFVATATTHYLKIVAGADGTTFNEFDNVSVRLVQSPAEIAAATAPAQVAQPTVSGTTLSWTAPANGGSAITDYIITLNGSVVSDGVGTGTSYTFADLAFGDYTATVAAVNALGTGPASAPAPFSVTDAYEGLVATRTEIPNAISTTNRSGNCRSAHYARDAITALKIELPNWYWHRAGTIGTTQTETNGGGNITYRAAIEYPADVFTQITFGGSASAVVASGSEVVSDSIPIVIPDGALFWIRTHAVAVTAMVFASSVTGDITQRADPSLGDIFEFGSTTQPDKTMGGALIATTTASHAAMLRPTAIIGMTNKPSVLIIGDSKAWGSQDVANGAGDVGEIARGIGPHFAYTNAASPGDFLNHYITRNTKRTRLKMYCSHVIIQTAINSLRSGGSGQSRTAAAALAEHDTVMGLFSDKRGITVTTAPSTTSSDGWATVANQTVNANQAAITAWNDAMRAGRPGAIRNLDIADYYESAQNSGRWKAPNITADGLHSTAAAYQAIAGAPVYSDITAKIVMQEPMATTMTDDGFVATT